jgi:hypothetical protein
MILSRIDAAMNMYAILLVIGTLASPAVYSDGRFLVVDNANGSKMQIEGEDIDLVNLVFKDFLLDKRNEYLFSSSDALRKIKYYAFTIEKRENSIFVHVSLDFVRVWNELDLKFKSGGVQYEINRKDFSIMKKLFYK